MFEHQDRFGNPNRIVEATYVQVSIGQQQATGLVVWCFGRGGLKVCLLYTSDAADDVSTV